MFFICIVVIRFVKTHSSYLVYVSWQEGSSPDRLGDLYVISFSKFCPQFKRKLQSLLRSMKLLIYWTYRGSFAHCALTCAVAEGSLSWLSVSFKNWEDLGHCSSCCFAGEPAEGSGWSCWRRCCD